MPFNKPRKFYISSGELRFVCIANNGLNACKKAVEYFSGRDIDIDGVFCLHSAGFRDKLSAEWVYKTSEVYAYIGDYEW